jgi:hypothetical protein
MELSQNDQSGIEDVTLLPDMALLTGGFTMSNPGNFPTRLFGMLENKFEHTHRLYDKKQM